MTLIREEDLVKALLMLFNIFHIFTHQILLLLFVCLGTGRRAKVQKMQWQNLGQFENGCNGKTPDMPGYR